MDFMKVILFFVLIPIFCWADEDEGVELPIKGKQDVKIASQPQISEEVQKKDPARKNMDYSCKSGNKKFDTKIVIESDYGTPSMVGDIEIQIQPGKSKVIPLNMSLYFGSLVVGSGKGSVSPGHFEGDSSNEDEGDSASVAKMQPTNRQIVEVARKGNLNNGYYAVASKVEVKSGSCSTTVPVDLLVAKSYVDELSSEMQLKLEQDKMLTQCRQDANSKSFQGLYAQIQLCALVTCESAVNSLMATEKRSGNRSGFVNKVKMAAYGYYLEHATQTRKKLGDIAKQNGFTPSCPAAMQGSKDDVQAYHSGTSIICSAPVKYSGAQLSTCLKEIIGYTTENKGVGYFNPVFAVYNINGSKFDFSSSAQSFSENAAQEIIEKEKRKPTALKESVQEDDPDVVAKKEGSKIEGDSESERNPNATWLIRFK